MDGHTDSKALRRFNQKKGLQSHVEQLMFIWKQIFYVSSHRVRKMAYGITISCCDLITTWNIQEFLSQLKNWSQIMEQPVWSGIK